MGRKVFVGLVLLLVVLAWYGFSASNQAAAPSGPVTETRYVTIDGTDGAGGIIDPVNVWNDYKTRSAVVARLHHGDSVKLLGRDGEGAQIETSVGTRGWVSRSFIRELR